MCFSCISYLSFGIEIAAETKPQPCYILLKIDFKRDIIRAKIWFPYGKRLLANNMTGQGDVRLCKLGGG